MLKLSLFDLLSLNFFGWRKFLIRINVLTLLVGFMDSVFLATRFCSSSPAGLLSWDDLKERN